MPSDALACLVHPQLSWRMMMAYDSSQPPPSRLDDETIDALRVSMRQYLADTSVAAPLQAALVRVASEAKQKAILAEHLLIALKDVWNTMPEVRAIADASAQMQLLQRVVTMCIKEYYSV